MPAFGLNNVTGKNNFNKNVLHFRRNEDGLESLLGKMLLRTAACSHLFLVSCSSTLASESYNSDIKDYHIPDTMLRLFAKVDIVFNIMLFLAGLG